MTETVTQRRTRLGSIIQRSLGADYSVVASPDHPLVMRAVDVLVGGPTGLTAIMMRTVEEVRRPKLFQARLTLNRMALPPATAFIHLTSGREAFSDIEQAFSASLPADDRRTSAELVQLVRNKQARLSPPSIEKVQRLAEPRFANTYRLSKLLKQGRIDEAPLHHRRTNQMPARDKLSTGIDSAYFDGAPSPSALSAFMTAECDRWFLPDNGNLYITDKPAGLVFADSLPMIPGDPNKAMRAAAFAGWVMTTRNNERTPDEISEMVSKYTRPK